MSPADTDPQTVSAAMTVRELRVLIGRQIGLPDTFDGTVDAYRNLSAENQILLTQKMIAYIKQNPASFTPAQVQTATVESGRAERMTPEDSSFDVGLFFEELEREAVQSVGAPLADVGQGISRTVSLVGTLLPALALVAIGIAVWPYITRARSAQ